MPIVAFFGSRIVHFLRNRIEPIALARARARVSVYIILKETVEAFICSSARRALTIVAVTSF